MSNKKIGNADLDSVKAVEMRPGLFRRTLVHSDEMTLCHFTLAQGVKLELHQHVEAQSGYVLKGKVKFIKDDGTNFTATAGATYLFDSNEIHGIGEVLEPSEFIECFSPGRSEYL